MKTLSLIVLVLSFAITTPADKDGFFGSYDHYSCGEWVKYRAEGGLGKTLESGGLLDT